MVRPYSTDLRERVVEAVLDGATVRDVASRFGVAVSSVVKWHQRYRQTGSVAPGQMGGHRKLVLEPHRAFIAQRLRQEPHLSLHRLKDELAARGVSVSHNTVWTFLRREGLRLKKKACLRLSRRAAMLRMPANAGKLGSIALIHAAWCSLTRLGSEPTWRQSEAGGKRASV